MEAGHSGAEEHLSFSSVRFRGALVDILGVARTGLVSSVHFCIVEFTFLASSCMNVGCQR